jgi:mannose-6-phosphate isomerase-like protein (cupin superfamily)
MGMNMKIEKLIRRGADAQYAAEYGVKTRRLFPWIGMVNTKRQLTEAGCMYVLLEPGEFVDPHHHNEEETFIVVSGSAMLTVGAEQAEISAGDVAYIPRHSVHALRNVSASEPFQMLDMYWDEHGASDCSID